MKVQIACNILDNFLHEHNADLLTREAFTALTAYAKGVETKRTKTEPKTTAEKAAPVNVGKSYPPGHLPGSGSPWSNKEDNLLKAEFYSGMSAKAMAQKHERTIEAIAARLVRLKCILKREELPGYIEYRESIARSRFG